MRRFRIPTRVVALLALAAGVVAATVATDPTSWLEDETAVATATVRDTGTVQTSTLETSFEATGTIGYRADTVATVIAPPPEETTTTSGSGRNATTQVVVTPATMVITELVREGALVEEGHVLWRLGNEPTVVLYGEQPAFRTLRDGDVGSDVLQLETALVALGFDPDGMVTVDEEFTALTEAMVERWQAAVGADVDGIVDHGAVIFVDGPSLVGEIALAVGDTAVDGQVAFELRTQEIGVDFTVQPAERDTLGVGDAVEVRSNGDRFAATVASIVVSEDGGASISARPAATVELASDEVPVEVGWTLELAADVVTVPAEAIVRTDDQRTWVEVRDGESERWVEVVVGRVSGGRVEVAGDLTIGDLVIAP